MQTSSSTIQPSRKLPGMEGKCMRCGKPEHQPGQKCAAKNAKCKDCHKIGHFYKACQSKKKTTRANLAQIAPQAEQDTYYNPQAEQDTYFNDFTGYGLSNSNPHNQPNPPLVNMLKIVTHKEVYLLSRPSKAMAQWRIHYMPKEVYILSGPSELQPVADYITQYTHREKDLPQPLSTLEAQDTYREPATVISQALTASCKLRVDQHRMVTIPRVYRRTRSMLKIRCTNV